MAKITVEKTVISIIQVNEEDFISLTDIAKFKSDEPNAVIGNWMRNRNTIEYLGIWETLYNPEFKPLEFEGFRRQAGLNAFVLSPQKWVETTGAKGLISRSGRNGGTFAHKDIAFKFASWISTEFELYFIREFQRLKDAEQKLLGWSANIKAPPLPACRPCRCAALWGTPLSPAFFPRRPGGASLPRHRC